MNNMAFVVELARGDGEGLCSDVPTFVRLWLADPDGFTDDKRYVRTFPGRARAWKAAARYLGSRDGFVFLTFCGDRGWDTTPRVRLIS